MPLSRDLVIARYLCPSVMSRTAEVGYVLAERESTHVREEIRVLFLEAA
jgi:hypothetical protein